MSVVVVCVEAKSADRVMTFDQGSSVGELKARDQDVGSPNPLQLSIVAGEWKQQSELAENIETW